MEQQLDGLLVPICSPPALGPRPPAGLRAADWLRALERRKQLARAGCGERGRAVKMAAVVEVEVGGGAAVERDLDEVRKS